MRRSSSLRFLALLLPLLVGSSRVLSSSAGDEAFLVPEMNAPSGGTLVLLEKKEIPYLYHWTSIPSLQRYTEPSALKEIASNHFLAKAFPSLTGRKALYCWNNPIGGMGVSPNEMYADKTAPALIRLKLKKDLKVLVLDSDLYGPGGTEIPRDLLEQADVLFHTSTYDNRAVFREFVVLRDDAIQAVDVDPRVLETDIEVWLNRIRNKIGTSSATYMSSDLTRSYKNYRNGSWEPSYGYKTVIESHLEPIAQKYMRTPATAIPDHFRSRSADYCNELMDEAI